VVDGIDAAHGSLASLFFNYERNKSWRARDHENAIERGGVHSQIGKGRANSAVHIDSKVFLCRRERLFDGARCLHLHAINAGFARQFEQTCCARVLGVKAMTFCQRLGDNALQLSSLATVRDSIREFPPLNDYNSR